jgi:hypothetical protein
MFLSALASVRCKVLMELLLVNFGVWLMENCCGEFEMMNLVEHGME